MDIITLEVLTSLVFMCLGHNQSHLGSFRHSMHGVFGLRNCGRLRRGASEFGMHAHLSSQTAAYNPEIPASWVANHVSSEYAWSYLGSTGALARREDQRSHVLARNDFSMHGLRIHSVCNELYHAQPRAGTSSRNGQMTTTLPFQRKGRRYHKQAHSWGRGD